MKRPAFIRPLTIVLLVLGTAAGAAAARQPAATGDARGYYQSPTLHGGTLVFASEGDLWRVPVTGGTASRLTSHPTAATEPHISHDGRWVAFTGRYEGGADVYVMPLAGGPARRLTHESDDVRVQGWTPAGEVLYATASAVGPGWFWLLRTVHPETLERRELPLADAREGAFDGAGNVYFTRFGLDVTGDNARAYRGGTLAQLWRFRLDANAEAVRLAAGHEGSLTRPMWWNGQLYVVSDADGAANIWRLDPDGTNAQRLTAHRDFEVRGATHAGGRIAYQHGADIRLYDIATGTDALVDIRLGSDRSRTRTRWIDAPMSYLNSLSFAPAGDRVALTARGRIAIVGTGELRRIEIALPEASRARQAALSPDGAWVYAFADAGAEQEIWRFPADGRGSGERLTSDATAGHRVGMHVSPDGRHIAHHDRGGRLWLLDTRTRSNREIDSARGMTYRDVVWSADSRTLALVRSDTPLRRPQIVLYDVAAGRAHVVTSDRYESYAPAFSPDGRWLWFLSDRNLSISRIKHLFAGCCPRLTDADTCLQRSLPRTDRR